MQAPACVVLLCHGLPADGERVGWPGVPAMGVPSSRAARVEVLRGLSSTHMGRGAGVGPLHAPWQPVGVEGMQC